MLPVPRSTAYVWFDTEYSELDYDRAHLLQVAALVTDADLQRLHPPGEDLRLYARVPESVRISPWVEENLPETVKICRSEMALDVAAIEEKLCALVDRCVVVPAGESRRRPILAGNSIHADWVLARRFLPRFIDRLHYRQLDVTALKLQWQDWRGGEPFDKESAAMVRQHFPAAVLDGPHGRHDAYYDAQASITELSFYRHALLAR